MSPPPLPETRTILANINDWYSKLPDHHARPLTGSTRDTDALLYGRVEYADETLFLYGYTVGAREHCFFYDTPWDESGRSFGEGHRSEWYDGLLMPRPFRVRYSVEQPDQHELLDPLLREMMKRTLHRMGTRPAVAKPLTASAEEVLAHIDRWDERLRFLRRRRYITTETVQESSGGSTTLARFGDVVGTGDVSYVSYSFEACGTRFVFAIKLTHSFSRMTPSSHSPQSSRAERRAHLAGVRRQEHGLQELAGAQGVRVRFHPDDPGLHTLELPPLQPGAEPLTLDSYTTLYQLEPIVFPPAR
ncbi:hypothetical protein ATI61_105251 [Archangium gephyra]|uniref:Uncharacterized protein n=1 Tax=Archangium gephyra TaxID=48 RepID=A0AAC8TI29_9BACT|nr:hypothetical protein [Archangium gephyra]AKJ06778.1 Hypothetical protein AA314_08404 [Archangium gephyra]REG31924.1 hypothetical protein ATI61_105251 [Archangium gephyra]